ncbi:MAG: hypothetical protein APG12_01577 [Candidatus Methanofastidiosum methylothiophilum]|uniref:Uncharacterized protein n=1 Tax=Candidatus Methanofastidiosum methylothiophilum TaxID=1705564 RepID=A0A150IWC4_9EURY|nr:MAG: hypothetical protein APG10_01721 [Candidatus Methanofastidiosum methylthiophilus]KYC46596.1 MAG: hypothetical protein APG11_01791 [Candidatus Methanofastidiosum methylthiophilus]KYC49277.1 MAG: hypothetical protein APG12_01577 [Candidatus Methanofastidiosum methylthiophilus]
MKTGVGQTLAISFGFCNENKKLFIPTLLAMYIVYFLSVFLNNYFYHDIDKMLSTQYLTLGEKSTFISDVPSFLPPQFSEIFLFLFKGDLFAPFTSFLMGMIYISGVAVLFFLVESMYRNKKIESILFLKSFPKIVISSILTVILIVLGIMAFVLPGIFLVYLLFYVVPESTSSGDSLITNFKKGIYLVFKHPDYTLGLLAVITATLFSLNYILLHLNDLGLLGDRGIFLDLFFIFIRGVVYTWALVSNMVSYIRLES